MTELITRKVRAKSVSIAVERVDKVGKRKNAKTRNHIVPLAGMMTGDEAAKMGRDMAKELGVPEARVNVELYKHGEAPMEVNPRHRGSQPRLHRPTAETEIKPKPFQRVRRLFAGGIPQTPEEWSAHVAEFHARQQGD